MYQIDRNEELTTERLGKILADFQTRELPKLNKYYNYYSGKQAITQKVASDTGKPCNIVVVNYCYNIVMNYLGYMTGIEIGYDNDGRFDEIIDVLKYNDVKAEDSELLRNALIFGRAFEINYIDEEGKQRFRTLDPRECIPVYDDTLSNELIYVVRFYSESPVNEQSEQYRVEVYSDTDVKTYRSTMGFSSFALMDEQPHFFGQCPVTVFSLNAEEVSIFDKIMSLQDAYNELLSSEVDDFAAFADAYLVLKGITADEGDLVSMKEHRVLMMDADADAQYLTKSIGDTQIQNMLQNVNDQIHKISASPDFNDDKFMAQSGIAMRYKLVGFENAASAIESNMKKALQRRLELISSIIGLIGASNEELWREAQITFTRNLPADLAQTVQIVNQLRGIVSQETLLTLLPFVQNVDEEMERVRAEKEESMELYNFAPIGDEDDERRDKTDPEEE